MIRRSRRGWPAQRPPPVHVELGIKPRQLAAAWWAKLWLDSIEELLPDGSARLARGRSYARDGRVHELAIRSGRIRVKVAGSQPQAYRVSIHFEPLNDEAWRRVIASIAEQPAFVTELLERRMPRDINAAFQSQQQDLFPTAMRELKSDCDCSHHDELCRHVAATHYALGEAFDRDPFLLFELRGRSTDRVLEELRAIRGNIAHSPPETPRGQTNAISAPAIDKRTLTKADLVAYEQAREALPAMHLSFDEPAAHGVILRQLGLPRGWQDEASPADLLQPLVRAAADLARKMALAESQSELGDEADGEVAAAKLPPALPSAALPAGTRRRTPAKQPAKRVNK